MSVWHEVTNQEDVEISEDGKTIDILFSTDDAGNNYVTIPIEFVNHCKKGKLMVEFEKDDMVMNGHGPMTIIQDIAEHELFLSFNGDDQAVAFEEWMEGSGMDAFREWLKTYKPV